MAPRSFWKGYLKFSLVSCAVAMAPATSEREKLRFHTLNRRTGNRIESRYVDAATGREVHEEEEVKGYAVAEDRIVQLEREEIEAVALESTRTIDLETFVPQDAIGWIWLDRPHYLTPDDKVGEEAFAVIREAMRATGTVGIARVVLYRRERAVMLEPRDKGIVAWTLRYGDEVRDAEAYFAQIDPLEPDRKLLRLLGDLIDARTKPWSPEMVSDPVQARLSEIIEEKKRARKPKRKPRASPAAEGASEGGNVVSILDALRNSIATEKRRK